MGKAARSKRERRDRGVTGDVVETVARLASLEAEVVSVYGDGLWERLDRAMVDWRKESEVADWCPLPASKAAVVIGEDEHLWPSHGEPRLWERVAWHVHLWRFGRGIYRVDRTLAAALAETEDDLVLPLEVLRRIPEWGIYLLLPEPLEMRLGWPEGSMVHGALVALDAVGGSDGVLSVCVDVSAAHGSPEAGFLFPIPIALGRTVSEGIEATAVEALERLGIVDPAELERLRGAYVPEMRRMMAQVLPLLLYLCASNADLREADGSAVRPSAPLRPPGGVVAAGGETDDERDLREERVVHVGWRVGAALRAARASSEEPGSGSGSVAPHLRRAHWHHYWKGSRSDPAARHIELKWLHPVLVGGKSEVPVVRALKGSPREKRPA